VGHRRHHGAGGAPEQQALRLGAGRGDGQPPQVAPAGQRRPGPRPHYVPLHKALRARAARSPAWFAERRRPAAARATSTAEAAKRRGRTAPAGRPVSYKHPPSRATPSPKPRGNNRPLQVRRKSRWALTCVCTGLHVSQKVARRLPQRNAGRPPACRTSRQRARSDEAPKSARGGAPQARTRARRAGAAVARRGWSRWAAARRWPAAQSPPAAGRARPRAGSRTAVAPAPPWPRTPLPAHELWQHARRICSPPALTACTQRRSGCSRRLESVQSRWTAQVLNSATLGAYRARMRPASAGLSWMCVCAASQASLRPESLRRVCHLPRRELGAPTLAQHLQKPCASAACLAAVGVLLARSSHLAAVVDGDVHRSSSSGRLA
jgi:hypothetical protein